jgi:hypothetical protein
MAPQPLAPTVLNHFQPIAQQLRFSWEGEFDDVHLSSSQWLWLPNSLLL